jgi:hypothetical protein
MDLTPTGIQLVDNAWNRVALTIRPAAGGSDVTLTLYRSAGSNNPYVKPYNNLFVARLNPYESRVEFGARTRGKFGPVAPGSEPASITLMGLAFRFGKFSPQST